MKKIALIPAVLIAALLFACDGSGDGENSYEIYYKNSLNASAGGDIIAAENVEIDEGGTDDIAMAIMERLLSEPASASLQSPFPGGTKLNSITISARHAQVDLTEQYNRLSGLDLTIADYCITLSLTQLTSIGSVSITVNGEQIPYRDTQRFMARDVIMTTMDEVVRTVDATLYYANSSAGQLQGESRAIEVYEGETQADKIMEELLSGPESLTLMSVIPDDVTVLYTQVDDGTCYVNLSQEFMKNIPDSSQMQYCVIYSIVYSLCSVNEINNVQILSNGAVVDSYGSIDISRPLE